MPGTRRPTSTKWSPLLGYSEVTSYGHFVRVVATAAVYPRNEIVGRNDPYAHTQRAIRSLQVALAAFGAGLEHVVRTRVCLADPVHWPSIARAHGEVFAAFSPECHLVGADHFKSSESLLEIEADAMVLHDRLQGQRTSPQRKASVLRRVMELHE